MKLLNHTSKHLSLLLLPVIALWAVAFYYAMLDEAYDSLDDSLKNQKKLLLKRIQNDPSLLEHTDFTKNVYAFKPISKEAYDNFKESFHDTIMNLYNEEEFESVRIHESAIKHNNHFYQLKIIASTVEIDNLVRDLVKYLIGLYLLIVVSLLLLNNIILKKTWKPFYHSINQLKKFKIEKENKITTEATDIDEFQLLNDTISKLIKKSSNSYTEQKQFIENASHELQTPVANSIHKLELFIENNQLDEKQTKDLSSVLDNLDRLTRLNKSLLLLSKIENKQFIDEERVDFLKLTETIIHDFKDLLAHKGMSINFESNSAPKIKMNKDLAIILLTNFIKNAITHGHPNTEILISLDNNLWSITNVGAPEALNQNLLFTRFRKIGSNTKSTGLGLAINKAIANKYDLELSYNFNDLHTFLIHFD